MSEFANTPEMDWFTAVEEGPEGGEAIGYDTLLGCQFGTTSISDADVPPTIEFKSGSRVIEYQAPKARRQRQIEDPQGDRFVCLWSPCKSTRPTFGRVAELNRHYEEQHLRLRVFDCVAVSCPAKGLRGFTRMSKLSIHLKTKHFKSTPFLCPVSQCDDGPFPADLLQVHMFWHNGDPEYYDYFRSIRAGTSYNSLCPVQGCTEDSVRGYHTLYNHDIDVRERDAPAILAAGFSPASGLPVCPVCNVELELDPRYFWAATGNTEHFLSHDWESLYKSRREILKICPEFGEMPRFRPVFEDIMPLVECRDVTGPEL